jgi:hypothetical protein
MRAPRARALSHGPDLPDLSRALRIRPHGGRRAQTDLFTRAPLAARSQAREARA